MSNAPVTQRTYVDEDEASVLKGTTAYSTQLKLSIITQNTTLSSPNMEHSTHRTSSITEDPTLNTPSSRSPPIALIFLSLLGSLYALTSNTPQAFAVLFLTTAIWYLTSDTPGRNYKDMIVYTILSYVSASLATSIFGNLWLRSVGAHVITFLSMDSYVRYLQVREEAARTKQKRDLQVAKYLDEPAPKGQDIAAEKVQEFMDGKDANVPTARKGPSTRRRG